MGDQGDNISVRKITVNIKLIKMACNLDNC